MNRVVWHVLAILLTIAPSVFAQEASALSRETTNPAPLSFEACYQKILGYYPALKKQKARVEEATASKNQAISWLFPRVQGTSSVTNGDDPVYVFSSLLKQQKFTAENFDLSNLNRPRHRTNFNFSLQGEVPVFNAFQTFSQIRAAKFLVSSEREQQAFVEMEASLLTLEAYLKALLSSKFLEAAREVENAGSQDLKQADELKTQGMVLGADFYAARMILSAMTQMTHGLEADQKMALVLLNVLMGEPVATAYRLTGRIPAEVRENRTLANWMEVASASRQDLAALRAKVEAQKAEVFREKASLLPRVSAFGSVEENTHDLKQGGESFMMGVKGTVDLLDISYWARKKKAQAIYAQLLEEEKLLKDRVAQEVSKAVFQFEATLADFPVAEKTVADGKEAVKLTESLYREGRKSIADLLEIRKAAIQALFRYEELRFRREFEYAALLFLTGSLSADEVGEMAQRIGAGA